MQKKWKKIVVSLCMMLTLTITFMACNENTKQEAPAKQEEEQQKEEKNSEEEQIDDFDLKEAVTVLGEGDTIFFFTVVDKEEEETAFEIHTEKETVGEALLELELIDGEDSEYGLYVKTVNGITADYDKDGMYWAFYINDEYADTGVDSTKITEGDQYSFRMEKG